MKKLTEYLEALGFSSIEARLYLTLFASGPMTVQDLAKATKINRTAAYSHITSLLEKGVLVEVRTGARKRLKAIEPEKLHYLIDNKMDEIKILDKKFPNFIQTINITAEKNFDYQQAETKYYKGKSGVKMIYEDCFKTDILRSYFNADDIVKIFPENIGTFQKAFITNPKIKMLEILQVTKWSIERMHAYDNVSRHSYRFLPKEVRLSANDILIYDGKVAIINARDENTVDGVILENRDYYNNSVQLFDLLWKLLPEPTS